MAAAGKPFKPTWTAIWVVFKPHVSMAARFDVARKIRKLAGVLKCEPVFPESLNEFTQRIFYGQIANRAEPDIIVSEISNHEEVKECRVLRYQRSRI